MSTAAEIIQDAYRESNLIALGQSPSTAQTAEALRRLNSMISALMGYEVSDRLLDWPVGTDNLQMSTTWNEQLWKYLVPNVRIIVNQAAATTLYLPPDPRDGARIAIVDPRGLLAANNFTLEGNSRVIENATSVTLSTNNLNREWMYRADLGQWVVSSILAATDDMPFPIEFDDFFITMLAMRMNPRYGRSISEETAVVLRDMRNKIRSRYYQARDVPADLGAVFLTEGHDRNYRAQGTARGRNSWMT